MKGKQIEWIYVQNEKEKLQINKYMHHTYNCIQNATVIMKILILEIAFNNRDRLLQPYISAQNFFFLAK